MTETEISAHIRSQNVGFLGILFFLYAIVFTFAYTEIIFYDSRPACECGQADCQNVGVEEPADQTSENSAGSSERTTESKVQVDSDKESTRYTAAELIWKALHHRTWRASIFAVWYGVLALLYLVLSLRLCMITDIPVLQTYFRNWLDVCLVLAIMALNGALVITARNYDMIPESFVYAWMVTILAFMILVFITVYMVVSYHRHAFETNEQE